MGDYYGAAFWLCDSALERESNGRKIYFKYQRDRDRDRETKRDTERENVRLTRERTKTFIKREREKFKIQSKCKEPYSEYQIKLNNN